MPHTSTSQRAGPPAVRAELRALGLDREITAIRPLPGAYTADVWLVTYAHREPLAAKTLAGAPPGWFQAEAEGLATLRATGHLHTPSVLAVTGRMLVLEALHPRLDTRATWQAFAHDLAALPRSTVHDRFGWDHDGYLGHVVQRNTWTASGHDFFAQHRVLRYLDEPLVQQILTPADQRALERFCDRLPELIPVMPAVLTHGDLWSGNLLSQDEATSPSSIPPSPAPGPKSTCPCCGAASGHQPHSTSSISTRNSALRRRAGPSACPCCIFVSC
jgi:fructosamine-3-kinase